MPGKQFDRTYRRYLPLFHPFVGAEIKISELILKISKISVVNHTYTLTKINTNPQCVIPVSVPICRLGKAKDNDVVLKNSGVCPYHITIDFTKTAPILTVLTDEGRYQ